jgi:hypothetical protein
MRRRSCIELSMILFSKWCHSNISYVVVFGLFHLCVEGRELSRTSLFDLYWLARYGKNVVPKSPCYIEQKTHHEDWVDAKSVKERFPLDYKEIKKYDEAFFVWVCFFACFYFVLIDWLIIL